MKITFTITILTFCLSISSQTGPGGIGNTSNNGLWLDASEINQADGTAVSNWLDISGNGNSALQGTAAIQPVFFQSSALNGMPIVRFDGTNDEMAIPDANILDNSAGLTYYAVIRPNNLNGSPRGILGKRISYSVNVEYAYTWFFYNANRLTLDIHTQNNRFGTSTAFANATNYILAMSFDGSLTPTVRSKIYSQGVKITESTESSTSLPNSNQEVALGALNVGYGTYLGADYAEVIHFNYALNDAEHLIISNYLSAKYGTTLGANDLYVQDDPANGDFDYDVAGIGQSSSGTNNIDAKGKGIVRILNPSSLVNGVYLIWGHNNLPQAANNTTDVPATVQARLDRVWRVSEVDDKFNTADVGAIDMQWDLSTLGPVTASDVVLLVDEDNDGSFNDETPIMGAINLGGNIIEFSNVTAIEDNLRFTLGTLDLSQTPLPVELVAFNAQLNKDKSVDVTWNTASEINTNHFRVERSMDGIEWTSIMEVEAAGNSNQELFYAERDNNPLTGVSYYRLVTVDDDGTESISKIEVVNLKEDNSEMIAYPNPFEHTLTIYGAYIKSDELQMFNAIGQLMNSKISSIQQDEHTIVINTSTLPRGVYYVSLKGSSVKLVK